MFDLKKASVRWDRENYVPKKVTGILSKALSGTPEKMGRSFLKECARSLKISVPLDDLQYETTTESLGSKAVLFQQHFKGVPIHGAWVAIHINNDNQVFMVKNDTIPLDRLQKKFAKKASVLPAGKMEAVISKRIKELGTLSTKISKERMIYPRRGSLVWVWKVKFGTTDPAGSWVLFIDQTTGHVVDERDILRKTIATGRVFFPNPVVVLNRDDLYDQKDKDQSVFDKAYKTVELKDLAPGGYLKGLYADTTKTPRCARSTAGDFRFTRYDDRFEEVMAYYHIDRAQRYIQSLGFAGKKGFLNRPIKINAHGLKEDNSYYDPSPGKKDLTFGDGGVDDAEDAEIIMHEYGHAIQDAIIPGWGQNYEAEAMGEGFGDYWAATLFASEKTAKRKTKFAEWDIKGVSGGVQGWLRTLDSDKHYPEDMVNECHDDGEIWSACLWKVHKLLGRKKADTVILESHFYLNQYCDFKDGAEAMIMAEQNLYHGKRTKALTKIFKERGIL